MPALTLSKEAHVAHAAAGLAVDESVRLELLDFGTKNLRNENVRQSAKGSMQ